MLSLKGFFRGVIERSQRVPLGRGVRDKLRFLGIAVLLSVPRTIRKRSSFLDEKIEEIAENLYRNTIAEIDGIKYALLDLESLKIISYEFESFMQIWLKPRRGEVFVDIGAHIGRYTLNVAKAVKNEGTVVAIEPHPANYRTLLRNVRLNKLENVVVLNLAAWNSDGKLKLFIGHKSGHHSVKRDRRVGWVTVNAMVMDHVLKELRLGSVDWIKIDVEGAECEVLFGLEETIKAYRPKIIVEVFHENVGIVKEFMENHEYCLLRISPAFTENIYFLCYPATA